MKKALIILFITSFFVLSCSPKTVTLRRLDEVRKYERKLDKDYTNETLIREVIEAVQNGNRETRSEALWILAKLKTPLAYSEFLRLSIEDPDFNVRAMAVYGLGELGLHNPEVINRIRIAMSDIDISVQIEAINVAGKIIDKELLVLVLKNLSSKNKWVRMASIEALKDYDDKRVDSSLNAILRGDVDYAVRSLASQIIEYRNKKDQNV